MRSLTTFSSTENEINLELLHIIQGGSNTTGTNCDSFTHKSSRSYLNHLVFLKSMQFSSLILFAYITNSMEQSPYWEANTSSVSTEIPRILCNPKVRHRIHNSPPPVPVLSHIYPVHTSHPTSRKSILILSSHLRLGLPSLKIPHQNPVFTSTLPHTCYMHYPSKCSWFDHSNDSWWEVQSIKLLVM